MALHLHDNRFVLDDDAKFDGDKLIQSTGATTGAADIKLNVTVGTDATTHVVSWDVFGIIL